MTDPHPSIPPDAHVKETPTTVQDVHFKRTPHDTASSSESPNTNNNNATTTTTTTQGALVGNVAEKHMKSEGVKRKFKDAEFHWKHLFTKKQWIPYWLVLIVLAVLVVLMTVYHDQIIDWLRPVSNRIRSLSWGWLVPILVLIVLSFPPLFGHEIVIILCGIIWDLWVGFGIAAAGTFLGEILTYIAFRTFLYKRAVRTEARSLNYGALALMTRKGGFWIVFIVRLSVIPSHFTTAVFAVCGVKFWIFAVASFITLPKQLIIVYLGVIFNNPKGGKRVSDIVLGVTFLITLVCGWYIWRGMLKARKELIEKAELEWEEEEKKKKENMVAYANATGQQQQQQQQAVSGGVNGYHTSHPYYQQQKDGSVHAPGGGGGNQATVEIGGAERDERIEMEANEIGFRGTKAERDIEAQNEKR